METHDNLSGSTRARANIYVRKSRVLARLTRLTWRKLILPVLKDFVLRSQGYQDKVKFRHEDAFQQSITRRIKDFFRDPEVREAVQEFFKLSGRDQQD